MSVYCSWMSVKEAALLAGSLAQVVPLPAAPAAAAAARATKAAAAPPAGASAAAANTRGSPVADATRGAGGGPLLSEDLLTGLGSMLLEQLLLVIKHTGAVDKAEIGLCTLASKSLRCVQPCGYAKGRHGQCWAVKVTPLTGIAWSGGPPCPGRLMLQH
eukprot:1158508-Pelagomonas_calceolata.AAC.11